MSAESAPEAVQVIERLVRLHNALLAVAFVAALGVVGIVQTTHFFPSDERPWFMPLINVATALFPILMLLLTAWLTHVAIRGYLRAAPPDAPIPIAEAARLFDRTKRRALWLTAAATVAASASLLFGHRTLDVALVVFAFLVFVFARPGHGNIEAFANLIETFRGDVAPNREDGGNVGR